LRDPEEGAANDGQMPAGPTPSDSPTTSSSTTSTVPVITTVQPPTPTPAVLDTVTPSNPPVVETTPPGVAAPVATTAGPTVASELVLVPAPVSAAEAVALINRYLLAAGDRRYQEAFALLSPAVQADQDGYDGFVRFWSTIEVAGGHPDEVEVEVIDDQPGRLTVTTRLFFEPIDRPRSVELVRIVVARSGTDLVIDYYDADQQ
jgi:hypothetical protein